MAAIRTCPKSNRSKMMMPLFNNFPDDNIIAFTSDRSVDFTLPYGQNALNPEQKQYLQARLKTDWNEPVQVRQVHGNKVIIVENAAGSRRSFLEEADGLVTKTARLPLAIRTADCLPVFLYDQRQQCIGLIHAGWKGGQKNIITEACTL